MYYLFQTLADIEEALGATPEGQAALADARQQLAAQQQQQGGSGGGGSLSPGGEVLEEVQAALADDFNTPQAIAAFSAPLKAANDLLHTKKASRPQRGRLC